MKKITRSNERLSKLSDFIVLSNEKPNRYKVKRIIDNELYKMHKIPFNNKSIQYQQNAITFINILSSIQTPYAIQYKDSFYDFPTHSIYLITELFCHCLTLTEIINERISQKTFLDEADIIPIITSITQVMNCFHQLHLAMSFLNTDIIYLNSKFESKIDIYEGFLSYKDNYSIDNAEENKLKEDIWEIGNMIYFICTFHCNPFNNNKEKMIKGLYQPIPYGYSDSLGELIKLCLQYQPQRRPNIKQIISLRLFKQYSIFNNKNNVKAQINEKKRNSSALFLIRKQAKDLKLNPCCFNQTAFKPNKKAKDELTIVNNTESNQSKPNNIIQPHYRQGKLNCKHNHELNHNKSFSVIDKNNKSKSIPHYKKKLIQSKSMNKIHYNKNIKNESLKLKALKLNENDNNRSFDLNAIVKLNNIQSINVINKLITNHNSNQIIKLQNNTNEHDYYLYPCLNPRYPQKKLYNPLNTSYQTYNRVNYNFRNQRRPFIPK